jgi:chromosome segregation protein
MAPVLVRLQMRFTRLRLNGFKSFVDPTDLVIANGLTGVVGPNGCGKSNLLEALRWVMGENRPTAMRGGEMEDVIFAGAATRGARHYAEVSLAIDNTERLAPAGFNDSDVLEIVRRITRDAGSAYRVNGKEVRARDVQMLFADASTGAHSPALVRQGQISELINARPQARRRILEEAAGISGLYQRRHEAELKLNATEANLARVDDVIEALAQQLATLARQAKQAARYREIGGELRRAEGTLLYGRWREAEAARVAAEGELGARVTAASMAERRAREAVAAREAAEAALPPLREEAAVAGAVLQRLLVERDALAAQEASALALIDTLEGRLAQLVKDAEREEALNRDAGETIRRLEGEATSLARAAEGHGARLDAAAVAAREAAEVLRAREEAMAELSEDVARLAARHHSAERLVEDSRKTEARSEAEAGRARTQLAEAQAAEARAGADFAAATAAAGEAQRLASDAEAVLAETDEARSDAQGREAEARAGRSEAEGELNALRAEVAALGRLLARDVREGASVIDLLSVESGYEKALGAALADDLRAPLVGHGRRSGWAALPDYVAPQALPAGVEPLALRMSLPEVLRRRLAQVGLVQAAEGDRLQAALLPGQRLVSREGDLWRWDGFRAAAADAPSAAALRLTQLNRLESLKQETAKAEARAAGASQAHEALKRRLADLTGADARAREARREADRRLGEAVRATSKAEAERNIAAAKVSALALAVTRHEDERRAAALVLAEAEAQRRGLPDLAAARAAAEDVKVTVEAARVTMLTRRTAHDEVRRDGEARGRRAGAVAHELAGWRQRLETADRRLAELADRERETAGDLMQARLVPGALGKRREDLAHAVGRAEARQAAATDALAQGEAALRQAAAAERDTERLAGEAREARARGEARVEAAREAAEAAAARIGEELELTPGDLMAQLNLDSAAMPDAGALEIEVNRLKRQREALGAVNLRAEEDARTVEAEHGTLVSEKADLEEAVRKLRAGIAGLNREGRERLLTAFEQVNGNFSMLFKHLFGGGEARLTLVESDDPLEAGLEILCQPPGKKLSTLSLLSGGEQTLTALALIFGVFLANPAPICVLDEVDAPLDDANVTRFCDLMDEMTRQTETRFLVITHHAVTMSRMDRLFGVTMGEKGVSQLVSVDLRRAESLVA